MRAAAAFLMGAKGSDRESQGRTSWKKTQALTLAAQRLLNIQFLNNYQKSQFCGSTMSEGVYLDLSTVQIPSVPAFSSIKTNSLFMSKKPCNTHPNLQSLRAGSLLGHPHSPARPSPSPAARQHAPTVGRANGGAIR